MGQQEEANMTLTEKKASVEVAESALISRMKKSMEREQTSFCFRRALKELQTALWEQT